MWQAPASTGLAAQMDVTHVADDDRSLQREEETSATPLEGKPRLQSKDKR